MVFHRQRLAERFADLILSDAATSGARSGIFLSAPRRTGKSTFMVEDLKGALEAHGALVIYVDLWADKTKDPADAIVQAIRGELSKNDGALLRLAKVFGMESLDLKVEKLFLDRIGLAKDISLSDALAALSSATKKQIVLIIDEAPHAITTKEGENSLFALKAARDKLNSSDHYGLRIVATGSNRTKLAMLTSSKDQAFFSAPLIDFPNLDRDYVDWFCRDVGLGLTADLVMPLFEKAGRRPEVLNSAGDAVKFDFSASNQSVAERFALAVDQQIARLDRERLPVIESLTPLQLAVLRVMAQMSADFAPFEARTQAFYTAAMAEKGTTDVNVDTPAVQQALSALRDKGLVWKARRGVYDLEDASIAQHLAPVAAVAASRIQQQPPGSTSDTLEDPR
jgi:hypothetical protein